MSGLRIQGLRTAYGALEVLHGIDLEVEAGEFVVFVGPSGCGKSTLLRMIAGLEDVTAGTISIEGRVVNALPPARRQIAMVFQSYALYPHMSVYENMAYGLRMARTPKAEIDVRVRRAAAMLQVTPLLDRLPKQLSGGQRQRVAIGRAITRDPRVFLFDEPLSNLDAALRVATRIEIARLKERLPDTTMVYVTHDQTEAMTLADRIVVLNAGKIEQFGTPLELYHNPANRFVAGFIGSPAMNFLEVHAQVGPGGPALRTSSGDEFALEGLDAQPGRGLVTLGLRPEDITVNGPGPAIARGRVGLLERLGELTMAYVETDGAETVVVKLPGDQAIQRGTVVSLHVTERSCTSSMPKVEPWVDPRLPHRSGSFATLRHDAVRTSLGSD
jgi:ABC-type sugar transport system ATPase subunit